MRNLLLFVTILSVLIESSVAPPVNQKSKDEKHENENEVDDMEELKNMEYRRYLMEVVQVLESDPHFREKLVNANAEDIHTGRIAEELQFVNYNIRSRLDELKREEMERLKHLATKENEIRKNLDIGSLKIPEHLDHTNTRSFEIYDLKKLIQKTAKDLTQIDKMRRAQFKEHEMEKEYEEQEKLKQMSEKERKEYEQELEELKEKQRKHEPVHHPGSKQQLEAVWEQQDHMESDQFDPKVFFLLHDIDGNGQWDQDEVKTLFLKELDKLYAQGASQEDLLKRAEEMERMREHVFNEADVNKDGLIHIEEFLLHTMQPDFRRDQGWQGIDEQQIFSPEEFEAFKQHRQEEMQKMMAKGVPPPHPGSVPAQHQSFPLEYGHGAVPQGVVPPQANSDPNVAHQQQLPDQAHPTYHQQPSIVVAQQQQQQHQQPQGQVYQYQQQQYNPGLSQQQHNPGLPQQQQQQQHNPGFPQQQNPGVWQQQHNPELSQQHQQPLQGQVPVQQLHPGAVPVQHHQDQVPVQQQGQIPVSHNQAHSADLTQQQAHANPAAVAHNIASNAAPQQNPGQGNSHAAVGQPEANQNRIPAAGKA